MTIEKRIEAARKAVREHSGEQAQIARDIGVSYQWLRQFASGIIKDPSAVKFAHLEEWLAKH